MWVCGRYSSSEVVMYVVVDLVVVYGGMLMCMRIG